LCYAIGMPTRSRLLSTADLTEARRLYEVDGFTYRQLGERFGVAMSTIRTLLVSVGVTSRPEGFQRRQPPLEPTPAPPPRFAVEVVPEVTGRLRIPMRTAEERRVRRWTGPELAAIAVEIASGRVTQAPCGRSGLPETNVAAWRGASFAFVVAMKRLHAA
jgi:hypothetical protein